MRSETDDSIAISLETAGKLFPASAASEEVPDKPGFYSIFIDSPQSLPEPFASHLREKDTLLIYIGLASRSLLKRLVEQDLHHKNPSTFFRAIGSILGHDALSDSEHIPQPKAVKVAC